MPIHVVYPSGRLLPERVRVAIEALEALRLRVRRRSRDLWLTECSFGAMDAAAASD